MAKAVYQKSYGGADVLEVGTLPVPTELPEHAILVKNFASGVNPIDYKVRSGLEGAREIEPTKPLVIGWDGAGVVERLGPGTSKFKVGDKVYYAGDITKQGSYSEYTVVDERITALKPEKLSFLEASTIPLVALTAWETMQEICQASRGETILIFNAAGGVGSIAIQLAKHFGLTVIATASRDETRAFVKKLGADHIINHKEEITPQLEKIGMVGKYKYVFHLAENKKLGELMKSMAPFGKAVLTWPIDEAEGKGIDHMDCFLARKSIMYEIMYARSMFGVEPEKQGVILKNVAELLDTGVITHTMTKTFPLEEVRKAHALQESGTMIGKMALEIIKE